MIEIIKNISVGVIVIIFLPIWLTIGAIAAIIWGIHTIGEVVLEIIETGAF
jgi:hypothetical protein